MIYTGKVAFLTVKLLSVNNVTLNNCISRFLGKKFLEPEVEKKNVEKWRVLICSDIVPKPLMDYTLPSTSYRKQIKTIGNSQCLISLD